VPTPRPPWLIHGDAVRELFRRRIFLGRLIFTCPDKFGYRRVPALHELSPLGRRILPEADSSCKSLDKNSNFALFWILLQICNVAGRSGKLKELFRLNLDLGCWNDASERLDCYPELSQLEYLHLHFVDVRETDDTTQISALIKQAPGLKSLEEDFKASALSGTYDYFTETTRWRVEPLLRQGCTLAELKDVLMMCSW